MNAESEPSIALCVLNQPSPDRSAPIPSIGKENRATRPAPIGIRRDHDAVAKRKRASAAPSRRSTRYCRTPSVTETPCQIPTPSSSSTRETRRQQTVARQPIVVEDMRCIASGSPYLVHLTEPDGKTVPDVIEPSVMEDPTGLKEAAVSEASSPAHVSCSYAEKRVTRSASRNKTRSASLNLSAPVLPASPEIPLSPDSRNATVAASDEAQEQLDSVDAMVFSASPPELLEEERRARAVRRRSRVFSQDPEEDRILSMLGRRPMTANNVRAAFLELQRNSPQSPLLGADCNEKSEEERKVKALEECAEPSSDRRRSKRTATNKLSDGGSDASPKKTRRKGRPRKSSIVASHDVIDDEAVLRFIYDPEIAKKEHVVTGGTPLETIYELDESASGEEGVKVFSKKKEPRLMVFPTNPEENCKRKRKARKERVRKVGLKLVKGVGAVFDRSGKLDSKKLADIAEEMEKIL